MTDPEKKNGAPFFNPFGVNSKETHPYGEPNEYVTNLLGYITHEHLDLLSSTLQHPYAIVSSWNGRDESGNPLTKYEGASRTLEMIRHLKDFNLWAWRVLGDFLLNDKFSQWVYAKDRLVLECKLGGPYEVIERPLDLVLMNPRGKLIEPDNLIGFPPILLRDTEDFLIIRRSSDVSEEAFFTRVAKLMQVGKIEISLIQEQGQARLLGINRKINIQQSWGNSNGSPLSVLRENYVRLRNRGLPPVELKGTAHPVNNIGRMYFRHLRLGW